MNTAMDFEQVINSYIAGFANSGVYAAGIYNTDLFGAKAMIYTILTTESSCHENKYSETERRTMNELKEKIASEEFTDLTSLVGAIVFLKSVIER